MRNNNHNCLNSKKNTGCEARQYSCQMRCERCNLTWDINDPDRPNCLTGKEMFDQNKDRLKRMVR